MGSISDERILSQPALGEDVQLGMLYDVRTSQFFAGISLWDNDIVNAKQTIDENKVQNADFIMSYSLEEARKNSSLDIEGSLSLDLNLFSATGSAKYLNNKKSSTHEARLDASCKVVRHTRRIPQEVLASMTYEKYLDDPRYTHFVAEVVEGGSATLTFIRSCSSAEEATNITGELKVGIVKIPVKGSAKLDFQKESESLFEQVKISYSGSMIENVSNLEDARRVAREMPTNVAKQINTLYYKLLPLSVLSTKANRLIRSLDAGLVAETAAALKAGTEANLKLSDLAREEVFQTKFPAIKRQIMNLQAAFSAAETEFRKDARLLLPELRDGNTNANAKITELQTTVFRFQRRTMLAEEFITMKNTEASVLRTTVAALLADKFENYLGLTKGPLIDDGAPRLLLSFGGPSIGYDKHPLQVCIESESPDTSSGDGSDDEDLDEEWFENQQTVANVRQSCAALRQQRTLAAPGATVTFGVASVNVAYRPGYPKKAKTSIGDIVLQNQGKLLIVTGMLPRAPKAPKLTVNGQTITVEWEQEREEAEEIAMRTTGFTIKYRRLLNPNKDSAFPKASENEVFIENYYTASEKRAVLESLSDACDYQVALSVQTIVGVSPWSTFVVNRTAKKPSVASEMIDFFNKNKSTYPKAFTEKYKPWDMYTPDSGNSKKTLFLGLTEQARRFSSDQRFPNELTVRIVDVAAEFKPEIKAADITDRKKTVVVVFAGTSGHGKSTQINAFISYLLSGEVDDPARILAIDDRGAAQADSVTKFVTCFRIRPLSPLFNGKTLLIVDTPGYGDAQGVKRDAFVTAAMSEFFKTVGHVNAIFFTCRANEVRTTLLSPVSTYVFSLFAKDVQRCLRTIYTFSDAGAPLARGALQKLHWPVENGEISVNNSAFTIEMDGSQNDIVVREGWVQSVRGQHQIMQMLLNMPDVPTEKSRQVTDNRIQLEQKCELAEKKILRTASDAQSLIARLDALADAVGAAPGQKIEVFDDRAVYKPVPDGKFTTLCLDCNFTCHEICIYRDDKDKRSCIAIDSNGNCTECKQRCKWDKHKNAQFIIVIEKHSRWMVPEELIKTWNKNNNSLEGALLTAMDTYLSLQKELRDDILLLAKLSEKLTSTALLHDPTSLISYIETLIKTARARGAPPEQLAQLATAKNTLVLVHVIKGKGQGATRDSTILLDIIGAVYSEMKRRMELSAYDRAVEEEKPCSLYNCFRDKLPAEIKSLAPSSLKTEGIISRGAFYPENLRAVVKLVKVVLEHGGVVAALTNQSDRK